MLAPIWIKRKNKEEKGGRVKNRENKGKVKGHIHAIYTIIVTADFSKATVTTCPYLDFLFYVSPAHTYSF